MAETAPAAPVPAVTPAKAPKKKTARPAKKTGPSTAELILKAVAASKDRKGMSLVALKKQLALDGFDVENKSSQVKVAVKKLLVKGDLLQAKGIGAAGSFKASKTVEKPKKVAKKVAKKPVAKKPAAKKAVAAKKAPKKAKAATPKKAKKPAAAAKKTPVKKLTKSPKKKLVKKAAAPKKATTPKKAAKKVAKPKAVKPKKAAAKKPAKK